MSGGNGRVLRYPRPFDQGAAIRPDLVLGQAGFFIKVTDATSRTMSRIAITGFMRGFVQEVFALAAWVLALVAIRYMHTPLTAQALKRGSAATTWGAQ